MSLLINADSEYYSGVASTAFAASGLEAATFGIWVKRDSASSTNQGYATICRNFADSFDLMGLAHSGSAVDGYIDMGGVTDRLSGQGSVGSTDWQLLVFTYGRSTVNKLYVNGTAFSDSVSMTAASAVAIDSIKIGQATTGSYMSGWHCRARLAHCFFYNVRLSDAEVAELYNGGTAGAGKNPTAVQASALQFYAPLTTDETVHTGAVTLTATGSPTFDTGDNPNVEAVSVPAPTISTQPTTQNVTEPAPATFSATLGGGSYTGLQWERQAAGAGGWSDVASATSATLVTGATSVSGGSWNSTDRVRLRVDWSGGASVYSTDVALTVTAGGTAPAFTVQPTNQSVTVGSTATFTATATGSGTLTHQWQREPLAGGGFVDIGGATSENYTTPVTTITGGSANLGDKYRRVTTGDTAPPATSSTATLTVLMPLATTVSITLTTDGSTPAASLTNLKWAFYDQVTPNLFTAAPAAKGAVETTDGSGVLAITITGTALRVGDIGYLIVTNSDGTTTQGAALKAFAAPVVVS